MRSRLKNSTYLRKLLQGVCLALPTSMGAHVGGFWEMLKALKAPVFAPLRGKSLGRLRRLSKASFTSFLIMFPLRGVGPYAEGISAYVRIDTVLILGES